jgi:hypothetical protein
LLLPLASIGQPNFRPSCEDTAGGYIFRLLTLNPLNARQVGRQGRTGHSFPKKA